MPSHPTGSPTQVSPHTTQTRVVKVRDHGRLRASPIAATACAAANEPAHTAIRDAVPRRAPTSTPVPMEAGEIHPAASAT